MLRGEEPFEAFLAKYCVRCHGGEKAEGDVRIDRLSGDFKSAGDSHHWAEVFLKSSFFFGGACSTVDLFIRSLRRRVKRHTVKHSQRVSVQFDERCDIHRARIEGSGPLLRRFGG